MIDPTNWLVIDEHIRYALREDVPFGDVSTFVVMPQSHMGKFQLIAKQRGIICGLEVFERVFKLLDASTSVIPLVHDGDEVFPGELVAMVEGDVRILLSGERTALNYLQRMSGTATYANGIVKQLAGTKTQLLGTRKTTPGMRVFEKYAVVVGGATNHRYGLSDGVLLKDNHIDAAGGIAEAIEAARQRAPFVRKIEIEVESLEGVRTALDAGADIIMLDNMDHDIMAEAVKLIDGRALTEASGNIDASNVREYADLGIDYVSVGALTHSAPILDLSLKHLRILD